MTRRAALERAGRMVATATSRLRNEVQAPRFSSRAERSGLIPNGGVALYFATGPENFYQFEMWCRPLERLAEVRPVFVIVDRPDTGKLVQDSTVLPIAFARGSGALEELVDERDIKIVLYANQVDANFRMLRFPGPVHVQIGHGESDKISSVSNQHKAYDLVFVGGDAGRDRLGAALRGFDAGSRTVAIGRPQLDHEYPGAPNWTRDSGLRVWYAPTWEGDRPSLAYSSLVSHGVDIVEALLNDSSIRMIYRPHARIGMVSEAYRAADRRIRSLLTKAGDRHLIDTGGYGWQWRFADACVTDISAVAYDWLATAKPLLITEPVAIKAYRPPSALLDRMPLLKAEDAGRVVGWLHALGLGIDQPAKDGRLIELAQYYFGDTADQASSRRFAAAIDKAYAIY
jgi:hypothetical protein